MPTAVKRPRVPDAVYLRTIPASYPMMTLSLSLLLALTPPPPLEEKRIDLPGPCFCIAFGPDGALAVGLRHGVGVIPREGAPKLLRHRNLVGKLVHFPAIRAYIAHDLRNRALAWDAASLRPLRTVVDDPSILGGILSDRTVSISETKAPGCLALPHPTRGIRLWAPRRSRLDRLDVGERHLRMIGGTKLDRVTASVVAGDMLFLGNGKGEILRVSQPGGLFESPPSLNARSSPSPGVTRLHAHQGSVTAIAVTPDGRLCLTAGSDEKVRVWKLDPSSTHVPKKPEWEVAGHAAALSPDGRFLAVADRRGMGVYHAGSGISISWNPVPPRDGRIVRLRFGPDAGAVYGIVCSCTACLSGPRRPEVIHGGALIRWK